MKHGVSMLCLVALIRTTKNFFARSFNLLGITKHTKELTKLARTGSMGNRMINHIRVIKGHKIKKSISRISEFSGINETLCGDPVTSFDISYKDAAKNLNTFLTCEKCKKIYRENQTR